MGYSFGQQIANFTSTNISRALFSFVSHDNNKVRNVVMYFCVQSMVTRERCVLLVVPDSREYNNSAVVALRNLAVVSEDDSISFGIVDVSKQRKFLSNFDPIPAVACTPYHSVRNCVYFSWYEFV